MVGVDMRVERLGEEEGVEGCKPMVVERASGEVGVLGTVGGERLGFLGLWWGRVDARWRGDSVGSKKRGQR